MQTCYRYQSPIKSEYVLQWTRSIKWFLWRSLPQESWTAGAVRRAIGSDGDDNGDLEFDDLFDGNGRDATPASTASGAEGALQTSLPPEVPPPPPPPGPAPLSTHLRGSSGCQFCDARLALRTEGVQ